MIDDYIIKGITSQIKLGATLPLPYQIMATAPKNAQIATKALSRSMQSSTGIMGLIPTMQITKGILKELKF